MFERAFAASSLTFHEAECVGFDVAGDEFDIGHDADALNRYIAGGEILRRCNFNRAAIGIIFEDLYTTLSEAALPDDRGAAMVLECAGDDFGGRGAADVDQYGDGVIDMGAVAASFCRFFRRRRRALDRDDRFVALEE